MCREQRAGCENRRSYCPENACAQSAPVSPIGQGAHGDADRIDEIDRTGPVAARDDRPVGMMRHLWSRLWNCCQSSPG